MTNPTIYILGAGNIGKYVAHALATHVPSVPVTLIFRKRDSFKKFIDSGRKLTRWIDDKTQDSKSGFGAEYIGQSYKLNRAMPISNLIVATKGQQTLDPVGILAPRLGRNSTVLLLQNGLGVHEELNSQIVAFRSPANRPSYWAGICSAGISGRGGTNNPFCPFTFQMAGEGSLKIGPLSENEEIDQSHLLCQSLVESSPTLQTKVLDHRRIKLAQIRKLAMNAVINPLTVVHKCPNGALRHLESRRALPGEPVTALAAEFRPSYMVAEIGPVVRAALNLPSGDPKLDKAWSDEALLRDVLRLADATAENRSSMLQDIEGDRHTEIDYITGWIIRKARELGLKCPRGSQKLYHYIKFRKWQNGEVLR
ncbi:ketopantoate reductase PanE/ApbA-domain-containing protein [Apiosordaria backusii]|uniref:2-dehydropantoate 2-reductase n=1 Tax=Apiosordaria backusii TaxID=314023 RepID=A0AA39ZQE9_9PEZI|nr:ketopantoate reductase PanE/ApbA-domain-containing protein [Apiosordaria backusii]